MRNVTASALCATRTCDRAHWCGCVTSATMAPTPGVVCFATDLASPTRSTALSAPSRRKTATAAQKSSTSAPPAPTSTTPANATPANPLLKTLPPESSRTHAPPLRPLLRSPALNQTRQASTPPLSASLPRGTPPCACSLPHFSHAAATAFAALLVTLCAASDASIPAIEWLRARTRRLLCVNEGLLADACTLLIESAERARMHANGI